MGAVPTRRNQTGAVRAIRVPDETTMTLRTRILLSFVPLVVLLAVVGGVGIEQLGRTGGRIDAILRENYVSVQAMFQLNEALERIDSAFQFALSAREPDAGQKARVQFDANWR